MSTQLAPLSASVTRILSLTGFPKELKTRDIQAAFSEWESVMGGFRIKWIDDISLLIVFQDAGVAKRAYLHALANPPPTIFVPSAGEPTATIKPYDGPDAQNIIQNVNSRHNSTASRSHNSRASISMPMPNGIGGHGRMASTSFSNGNARNGGINVNGHGATNGFAVNGTSIPEALAGIAPVPTYSSASSSSSGVREPSPTLPSIPAQPTLNSLIQSSSTFGEDAILHDPAILSSVDMHGGAAGAGGPRIGDPGKRMLGAALGMRHPGLGPRMHSGGMGMNGHAAGSADQALKEVQKAMGILTVAE